MKASEARKLAQDSYQRDYIKLRDVEGKAIAITELLEVTESQFENKAGKKPPIMYVQCSYTDDEGEGQTAKLLIQGPFIFPPIYEAFNQSPPPEELVGVPCKAKPFREAQQEAWVFVDTDEYKTVKKTGVLIED